MKKNQNGVTLIALAVTIIVMLILAGATMSMLTGNSGIMTNAKKSSAASEEADAYEKMAQAFSTVQLSVESEAALNGGYDASEAAELTKYAQMAQKEIGTAQAIIEDSAKTTADLKANISKYNKKFVIWVDSSAAQKKIYMVYYSKTFALDPVTTSATTGPLQITGCVSSSNIKFKDTTSIPKFVIAGRMIPSAFPNNLS